MDEMAKRVFELVPRQPSNGVQQFVVKVAARDGTNLRHLPYRRQPIKTRHQRRLQRCWDRQSRQRSLEQ